jgi:hypothetical protein
MKPDFTPLAEAFDRDDWDWMNNNAPVHMAAIERMITSGATVEQIKEYAQQRAGPERQRFVARCEGAARYVIGRGRAG